MAVCKLHNVQEKSAGPLESMQDVCPSVCLSSCDCEGRGGARGGEEGVYGLRLLAGWLCGVRHTGVSAMQGSGR